MGRSLGVTTVTILAAIEAGVFYGLDIVHRTAMLSGTVYTTLRRLERKGLIAGAWEAPEVAEAERRPRRRYYELTAEGRSVLATARAHLESIGVAIDASFVGGAE